MPEENPAAGEAKLATLASIASTGDKWVKLATLALIALSGIGNYFATRQTGEVIKEQTAREVHELYLQIGGFQDRQMRTLDHLQSLAETNAKELALHSKVLGNQENFLQIFKEERENDINTLLKSTKSTEEKIDRIMEDLKKP
jgi:hypothetical protein